MKFIVALSSLTLVSFSSVSPCLAVNQAIGRSPTQSLSSQALPSAAKPIQVVGFGLGDILAPIERGLNMVEQEKRRQEDRERREQLEKERQERIEAQKKRQEELQIARQEATEKQRLEADRRQKYFESLSPGEQRAYIAEQRARQQKANEMSAKLFMMIVDSVTRPNVCRSGSWFTGYTYYEC